MADNSIYWCMKFAFAACSWAVFFCLIFVMRHVYYYSLRSVVLRLEYHREHHTAAHALVFVDCAYYFYDKPKLQQALSPARPMAASTTALLRECFDHSKVLTHRRNPSKGHVKAVHCHTQYSSPCQICHSLVSKRYCCVWSQHFITCLERHGWFAWLT